MTQIVVKTALATFIIAFATFSYGLFILGYISPITMAKFTDTLGASNASGMYYERVFARDRTPKNLYLVLNSYIVAQNHRKILTFAEELFEWPDGAYEDIVAEVNLAGRAGASNKSELLLWSNEDNRIKSTYAAACLFTGRDTVALARLGEWLAGIPDLQQPNHAYFAFVAAGQGEGKARELFETYVTNFTTDFDGLPGDTTIEKVFALEFLRDAHAYLGDIQVAEHYHALLLAELIK